MKKLSILLFILLPVLCFGQKNPCRKITRSYHREHGVRTVTFKTPEMSYFSAIKECKADTFLALHLHFYDTYDHFNPSIAIVEFEDGTILKDEKTKVVCQQEQSEIVGSSSLASHSGQYLLQGFFYIRPEYMEQFLTKIIVRIQLHNASQAIPAQEGIRMREFLKCMQEKRS